MLKIFLKICKKIKPYLRRAESGNFAKSSKKKTPLSWSLKIYKLYEQGDKRESGCFRKRLSAKPHFARLRILSFYLWESVYSIYPFLFVQSVVACACIGEAKPSHLYIYKHTPNCQLF